MKITNLIISFLFILCISTTSWAQFKKLNHSLEYAIKIKETALNKPVLNNKGYFFSLYLNVNTKGKIDSVSFSHFRYQDELGQVFDFEKIKKELLNVYLPKFKNKILVQLVMVVGNEEEQSHFVNGNQILNDWKNMSESSANMPREKMIQLVPKLYRLSEIK